MEAPLSHRTALYLYGIVAHPAEVPPCDAVEEGTAIEVIAGERVACVVSPVLARDYESAAIGGNAADQLEWVTPRAWRHHDVVRRLHLHTGVIPLKFGTLCASADDVREMLARCSAPLDALLHRFQGKDEWKLSIHLDAERVIARAEREDPELRELCARERGLPEGRAYFVRKKRQQLGAALLGAEREETTCDVYARIADYVEASCAEHTPAPAATLLVDRARFEDLTACLAAIEAAHAHNGLVLELRGPWAPYSFVADRVDVRELAPGSGIGSPVTYV